jgi:glucose/mannose-6-phosphate isomerase
MRDMIEGFPILLRETVLDEQVKTHAVRLKKKGIQGICMAGMGGSSIAGQLCKRFLERKAHVPIISVRDYTIPSFVNEKWVIIVVSYSGNTEETLSAFNSARNKRCEIIAITTGGKLGELAKSIPCHKLYPSFQPRAALPLIFSAVLPTLEVLLNLNHTDLIAISKKLERHSTSWGNIMQSPRSLAEKLIDFIPVFIGWEHLIPVAYRAKCQINENAKSVAIHVELPEMNHNEVEAIGVCKEYALYPIFLRSNWETERISKRFEATAQIYSANGCKSETIRFNCESRIEEMLAITHYLDTVSLELAELRDVDPVSVERITALKKILSGN